MLKTLKLRTACSRLVISVPDAYPINKAVLAGQRMELECKTSDNETVNQWTATRVEQDYEVIFRAKQQTNSYGKKQYAPVDNSKFAHFGVWYPQMGVCILYSNRTELNDAGIYSCSKNQDKVQSTAQLTVLGE